MRISESCAKCLFDRQKDKTSNEEYLSQVKKIKSNNMYLRFFLFRSSQVHFSIAFLFKWESCCEIAKSCCDTFSILYGLVQ